MRVNLNESQEYTLASPNRVRLTSKDKRVLRVGLTARMKVREDRAAARRKEYMK